MSDAFCSCKMHIGWGELLLVRLWNSHVAGRSFHIHFQAATKGSQESLVFGNIFQPPSTPVKGIRGDSMAEQTEGASVQETELAQSAGLSPTRKFGEKRFQLVAAADKQDQRRCDELSQMASQAKASGSSARSSARSA